MDPKQRTRQILDELAAERASHGYGAAERIDRRMNKSKGYLGRILRGDLGLHVETLFEALEALEVDPADFFARVTGTRVCPDRLLRRLERQAPANGKPSVLDRFEIVVGPRRVEVKADFDRPPGVDLTKTLDELDEVLFCCPDRALRLAEEVLLAAVSDLAVDASKQTVEGVCRALGALAAAYRIHAEFALAARGLRLGFRVCETRDLPMTQTELLLRACYLVGDHGEYDLAVDLARRASDQSLMLQDEAGLGKSLVVRAIMQNRLGQQDRAIAAYKLALEYLPSRIWIGRSCCYHGLGRIYAERRQLEDARGFVLKATETLKTEEGPNRWRLVWLRADIALEEGNIESATLLLRQACDGFAKLGNPFDVAVVSLRLAKALLIAGRPQEMQALASAMMRLLKPLRKHAVAKGVIHEFTCAALAGEVTLEFLEKIYKRLKASASCQGGTWEVC